MLKEKGIREGKRFFNCYKFEIVFSSKKKIRTFLSQKKAKIKRWDFEQAMGKKLIGMTCCVKIFKVIFILFLIINVCFSLKPYKCLILIYLL